MKDIKPKLLAGLTAGWFATAGLALAQVDVPPPVAPPPGADAGAPLPGPDAVPAPSPDAAAPDAAPGATTNATPVTMDISPAVPESSRASRLAGPAEKGLVPNFHGVPVDAVLKYLADAAGFTIVRDADTRLGGATVDLVSTVPLSKEEVVGALNKVLAKNDLAAVQDGKTLEIMTVESATLNAGTPVVVWTGDYKEVAADATVVTEIIPLHSLNPTQVVKDLYTLRPPDAVMSANEGGNAILMTAKRSDIRRFTQIIQALDSSGNGDLEVYLLSYADSKSIAQELKDVFSPPDATQNAGANPFAIFGNRGRGAGGGGGAAAEDNPKRAAIKVNAVSDDQNNAVLVSAPIDIMPGISNIIFKLDQPQEDTVQIRVFHLVHCDPTDIVNELSSIFPDPTYLAAQQGRNGGGGQRGVATFGGAGFGARGGGGGGAATSSLSDRMKKQTTVYSVADARTQSVIVTASKDTMTQIEAMIDHLDQSGARIQQVFVYRPQFSDVLDMQSPLQDLFMSTTSRSSSSTQVNALTQRAQQAAQTSTLNTSGSSALSGGSSGGGKSGP